MNVTLVGGMDRLARHYVDEAEARGVSLQVVSKAEGRLPGKIESAEAVILFTNKISHTAKYRVMSIAKARNIPVYMAHSSGVCSLRSCLECLSPTCARGKQKI